MSNPESTRKHYHGLPYARVDFIPQSGTLDLASGFYYLSEDFRSICILYDAPLRAIQCIAQYCTVRVKIYLLIRAWICNRLRSLGIDSNGYRIFIFEPEFVNVFGAQESIPLAYVAWLARTSNRVVLSARQAGNRFLGSLKSLNIHVRGLDPGIPFYGSYATEIWFGNDCCSFCRTLSLSFSLLTILMATFLPKTQCVPSFTRPVKKTKNRFIKCALFPHL